MFSVDRVIDAPADRVWAVLVDVRTWPQWGPSVSAVDLDGPGHEIELGSTGFVRTAVGPTLPFVITEFEPLKNWAWRIGRVAMTRHRLESVPGGTRVIFEVPWWFPPYLAVCARALKHIDAITTG